MQLILHDPLVIPACLQVGRAGFSQIEAVSILETLWFTKFVNAKHFRWSILGTWDNNSTHASFCATQVGNRLSNSVRFLVSSMSCYSKQSLHCSLVDTLPWATQPEMVMLSTTRGPMTFSGEDTQGWWISSLVIVPGSAAQSKQNGKRLCLHRMGCWLRWCCSLTQRHFLRWNDRLPCFAGTNQSGVPQWGTWEKFLSTHPQEQDAQKEEAFARATVALTRAQQLCIIMGPLDMRGLVGAATIWAVWNMGPVSVDDPVLLFRLKDDDLEAPDDSACLSLRLSCSRVNGVALVEVFLTDDYSIPRVRRLPSLWWTWTGVGGWLPG